MNHYQRMINTIAGEYTDRIPWAPRMDLWYIANRSRGTLPSEFVRLNTVEISELLDVACHAVRADYTLPGARDLSLRGLGMDNHPDYPFRIELKGLPVKFSDDGVDMKTLISTSKGEIFTHLHRNPDMTKAGISIPFVKSYAIENPDDIQALMRVFQHLEVIPNPEGYADFHKRIGQQGVAVASGPIAASPMHLILHELMPMDRFFYTYADNRNILCQLASSMEEFFHKLLDVLVSSDAEVVFWGGNYDQDLTWPTFFQKEITPWLSKVSERLHSVGKYLLTHTDGENKALMPYYKDCGFDVAESVCPAPMTQCSLKEIRHGMGENITVWGGIPSVALLEGSMDEAEFDDYLDKMFSEIGSGRRLILGVSDNVPPDAKLKRFKKIKEQIEDFGSVSN
ncbi:hypothetical protein GF312_07595 [Candidatus Poribacteria bacterium]|nr:hypothetical protein [Candidatus Poribacteria bacterium]